MPIRIFQMGYAFRNEISPRQMLLRTREFEQCEGQLFITPDQEMNFEEYEKIQNESLSILSAKMQLEGITTPQQLTIKDAVDQGILKKPAYAWLLWFAYDIVKGLGNVPANIRLRQHKEDEKAHYAIDAWDLEMKSALYGWTEVCGIHDRGDYDLGRHLEHSKEKKLQIPGPGKGESQTPHVLEIALGVGRLFFFTLEQAFKFEEERNVLDLPIHITPIPFAVFPLQKKPKEMSTIAQEIYEDLIENDIGAVIDVTGSIGKRYRRTEEVGVRFTFTIDHQTLDDGTLTIRTVKDMSQKRIHKDSVTDLATKLMHKHITFADITDLEEKK
jgi:glycyl-tRNA synthetase